MRKSLGSSRVFLSSLFCVVLGVGLSGPGYAASGHYWQDVHATVSIHNIATNGAIYVAGGGILGNGLWTSTDLKTWTRANLPGGVGPEVSSVIYVNGEFIAVANEIITSSDGVTWSIASAPITLDGRYSAITYDNGIYVLVGQDHDTHQAAILTSSDSKNWTSHPTGIPAATGTGQTLLDGIAWNGTRFVAMGTSLDSSAILDIATTSTDGKAWTQVAMPSNGAGGFSWTSSYNDVLAYGNGVFVGGGGLNITTFTDGDIYLSTDGLHWTSVTLPNGYTLSGIQFLNGSFIGAATRTTSTGDIETGYLTSKDGTTWTAGSVDTNELGLRSAGFLYSAGKYVIAGKAGVWSSPDLATWTNLFSGPRSNEMWCLGHGDNAGYVLLGLSHSDGVLTSPNGIDWPNNVTSVSANISGYTSTTYYRDGCIAFGSGGYVNFGFHSVDGITWQASTVPLADAIQLVANNGSEYLAVANNNGSNDVLVSTDGAVWTQASGSLPLGVHAAALEALNGSFVVLGNDSNGEGIMLTSTDGAGWTNITPSLPAFTPPTIAYYPHLAYGNGTYIAMWSDKDSKLYIAKSTDAGASWTLETDAFPNGLSFTPTRIAYGGGEWIAIGQDAKRGTGAFLVSQDGTHWTFALDNRISTFKNLLWDGTKFVATGTEDILNAPAGSAPGVTLDVTGNAPASVKTGSQFAIQVTVSNNGDVRADDVILDDTLPTGATFDSATASQGKCTKSGGSVSCSLGTIDIGSSVTVTLNFTSGSDAGSAVNKASAHARQAGSDDASLQSSTTVAIQKPQSVDSPSGGDSTGGNSGGGGAFGLLGIAGLLGLALRRRIANGGEE